MNNEETFPLDEETMELVQEYQKQILLIEHRMGGALDLFCRRHKLEGGWQLGRSMKELVKNGSQSRNVQTIDDVIPEANNGR